MSNISEADLLSRIQELELRLEESEQLIEAIKAGEVDAFAINTALESEIYTLQSGDYAYRVLIEEFEEGALNVTEEGLIVYTNPYFYKLLNMQYEEIIGKSIFDFIHPDSNKDFKLLFKESTSGKSKGEIQFIAKETVVPVYISLKSLQPKLPSVGIIVTDLTAKKSNEKIILEYQKNLEFKNQELLQMNAELASFTYIASHDLQEPLRKIQTFAARLFQKEIDNLSENGKNYFTRIQQAANRMQTLIEDLLVYSRTNTVERKYIKSNLNEIVKDVIEDLKEEIHQKNADIKISELGEARIIPFQFRQLIHNLLTNSLKFTIPEKNPRILINSTSGPGSAFNIRKLKDTLNYIKISVSDNGIGFDQQYKDKIFELFQRLHGKSEYKGTGIGLAIVKKIVDNHNGHIAVDAELHKGATFHIYIPQDIS